MLPSFINAVEVISLPKSSDRRDRLTPHLLSQFGDIDFNYFDACSPEDELVRQLFQRNKVVQYPPCFRCGKLDCGNPDCNNTIVPSQVAVFATYLKLWEKVSNSNDITLVLEDDVVIHDWAPRVLERLANDIMEGKLTISPDIPRLIRLGWALGNDHRADMEYRLGQEIKMSNPAHIITPAFARAMLQRFSAVTTTSDVFQHRDAIKEGEAYTVFPPIASELSWSVGSVESLIHPKPLRSEWLRTQGSFFEAELNDSKVKSHLKHIFHRPVLITGHPRCGTGFVSSLCRQIGLDIGHETDGKHGVSSWMMAADADENPWYSSPVAKSRRSLHWTTMVHVVRDLSPSIPSVMRENKYAPASYEFRRSHIFKYFGKDIGFSTKPLERAVLSIIYWNKMIRDLKPDITFRIQDNPSQFIADLKTSNLPITEPESLDLSPVNANKQYQGKRYPLPEISLEDWAELSENTMNMLVQEAAEIGCGLPFSKANNDW